MGPGDAGRSGFAILILEHDYLVRFCRGASWQALILCFHRDLHVASVNLLPDLTLERMLRLLNNAKALCTVGCASLRTFLRGIVCIFSASDSAGLSSYYRSTREIAQKVSVEV